MSQYNTTFDLRINLGHSDIFLFYWQTAIQASSAVLRQLLFISDSM